MEQKKVFRSRVSVVLITFVSLVLIAVFITIFTAAIRYEDYRGLLLVIILLIIALLPVVLIFAGMRYSISRSRLQVSIFGDIRISDIISIKRSYNPLSSPAASLKRLRVEFIKDRKKSWVLISPVREQEFIEMLKATNPDIKINVSDKTGLWRFWDWDI